MSEIFERFYTHGYLFKCDGHEFDNLIKKTIKQLINVCYSTEKKFMSGISDQHIHKICAICLQHFDFYNCLAICHNCCNVCIGKNIIIDFGIYYIYTTMFCYDVGNDNYRLISVADYCKHYVEFYFNCLQDTEHYVSNDDLIFRSLVIKSNMLSHFVNNLPKLKNRFYHVVAITFLLSLKDSKSSCYVLNCDIIFYVLKFIY